MNEKWVLRVPKDSKGEVFIRLFKKYLNSNSYRVIKRYTGKRPKGTNQHSTKEENATSTRLYIESKEENKSSDYSWYNNNRLVYKSLPNLKAARPVTHMPGSIVPILSNSKQPKEVKKEANSTIDKTRLASLIEVLTYKIEDLEEISNKHRKLNGTLRVEARELFKVATIMMSILEQIDFSSTGINTCYDEVPWNYLEETLNTYGK